jgi:choline-glycine betaine transporter
MQWLEELWYRLIIEWLPGDFVLELVDQYYTVQSDPRRVLMVVGVLFLSIIGIISVLRSILKLASNVLKLVIVIGLAYYILVVVLGIDNWIEIYSNIFG